MAYMERDLADGVAEVVFQDTAIFRGGFPEMTDRLAGLLDDTDFLTDLNDRLSALGEAYAEDKDLMRMHFYKPDKVASLFQKFAKPELLHHQKFFENGTAERAKESGTEQNYNMIDGCVNNVPKKPRRIGGRWSVLDRLHIKQAERRQKDNTPQQEQERSRKS